MKGFVLDSIRQNSKMQSYNLHLKKVKIYCRNWMLKKSNYWKVGSKFWSWIVDLLILVMPRLKLIWLHLLEKIRNWWKILRRSKVLLFRLLWSKRKKYKNSIKLSANTSICKTNSKFNIKNMKPSIVSMTRLCIKKTRKYNSFPKNWQVNVRHIFIKFFQSKNNQLKTRL